jgi:CO/xanthine dehydrogenase Mo-binding subunit
VELAPDGHIKLTHSGTEIGTGASSGQAVACARWLGRPADSLDMAVTQWVDLPVDTSGDPDTMSQADQDHLAKNPRWSPVYASASSASNSSYYFSHVTREAARIVFLHGLWPAALAIWARSGQAPSRAPKSENARWSNGSLTVEGMVEDLEPLPLARLAQEAHARGFVVGAAVHGFNRWQWAEADFTVDGASVRAPVDALSVRYGYGDGAGAKKRALATTPNHYQVLDAAPCLFHRIGTTTRWLATTPQSARWPSLRSTRPAERSRC